MPQKEIKGERTPGQRVSMKLVMHDGPGVHPFERGAAALRSTFKDHGYDAMPGNVIKADVYDIVATLAQAGFAYQPIPGDTDTYVRMSHEQEDTRAYISRAMSNVGFYRHPIKAARPGVTDGSLDFYWCEAEALHTYRATITQDGTVTALEYWHDGLAPINATQGWEDASGHRAWDRIVAAEIPVSQAL